MVKKGNYENMPSICEVSWIEFRSVFRIFKHLKGQESTHHRNSNNHIYLGQKSLCTCSNSLDEGFKLSSCFSFDTSSEQKVWFGAARGSNLAWPRPLGSARSLCSLSTDFTRGFVFLSLTSIETQTDCWHGSLFGNTLLKHDQKVAGLLLDSFTLLQGLPLLRGEGHLPEARHRRLLLCLRCLGLFPPLEVHGSARISWKILLAFGHQPLKTL